ncbi:MAG TPA: YwpF family protein [Savagea sp.]
MKTFKMVSIQLIQENSYWEVPLIDGIMMNLENEERIWLMELYLSREHRPYFEMLSLAEQNFEARVIISYPDNEPAAFYVNVLDMKNIGEDQYAVLLRGQLKRMRSQYAEQLLAELIAEGIEGEDLVERFEKDMKQRPRLKNDQ